MIKIAVYALILFASSSISNRIENMIGNYINVPYQWIYTVIFFIVGIFLYKKFKKLFVIFLLIGIAILVFDFRDIFSLEYWGLDNMEIQKLWRRG